MNLDDLFKKAMSARSNAYAPYSKFKVGAAIISNSGQIHVGANVENSSYPQGTCAEAGAIAAMIAAGDTIIDQMVVVGEGKTLCTPCGGCRQKIREFSTPSTKVHVADLSGIKKTYITNDLLPDAFGPENLT